MFGEKSKTGRAVLLLGKSADTHSNQHALAHFWSPVGMLHRAWAYVSKQGNMRLLACR